MDEVSSSGLVAGCDWSLLPEDLLLSVLRALHVADLLYASDGLAPDAAALHCPATGARLRIPFPLAPLARRPLLGSGHGWLVTADEASDPHLVNPVTGGAH